MRKLICLLAFASLYSCADDYEIQQPEAVKKKDKSLTSRMPLNAIALDMTAYTFVQGGPISNTDAQNNTDELNGAIADAKLAGHDGLIIDQLDCFFRVGMGAPGIGNSINIPTGFSLIMSENTHLRVQPNDFRNYVLINIADVSDVGIEGGNLYGDRRAHTMSGYIVPSTGLLSTDEFGYLIRIWNGQHVDVDGTRLSDATGDGIVIEGQVEPQPTSFDVEINGCVFSDNRRNNLSIGSGHDIDIHDCIFKNAGSDLSGLRIPTANGTAPRLSIDIEAERHRVGDSLVLDGHAYDIRIKRNKEVCGKYGGFFVSIGENVTIADNETNAYIGFKFTSGTTISHNNMVHSSDNINVAGIAAGTDQHSNTVFGNTIIDNDVFGYNIGISAYEQDATFTGNDIAECLVGIVVQNMKDCHFKQNNISNTYRSNAQAIASGAGYLDNVEFTSNSIWGVFDGGAIVFSQINQAAGMEFNRFTFDGNILTATASPVKFTLVRGLEYLRNDQHTNLYLLTLSHCSFKSNLITIPSTLGQNAIYMHKAPSSPGSDNIDIRQNTIVMADSHTQRAINISYGTDFKIISNAITHLGSTNTVWMVDIDNSTVAENNGNIGTAPYYMSVFISNNSTFYQNRPSTGSYTSPRVQFDSNTNFTSSITY